ncbi:hypothetical protein Daesc_007973 [Daldinia eschscholtzii]|uniref:Uncharacterized protein n=1 Tax=Daldinia eschscholtzii TaxID=292717 RepID=A0AAX6MFF8_9PEZI
MAQNKDLKNRTRKDYPFILEYRTRCVTYEIALFEKGVEQVKAVGEYVQVFVDRSTQRPNANGMNPQLRDGLEKLHVDTNSSKL